ncbi:MAG: beta strand repeat-containing protein, partial [Waterburya sp.]
PLGEGEGGKISINATDLVTLDASSILNRVESGAVGNGGDIDITTKNLTLTNGSEIATSTSGQKGDGGIIDINGTESVTLDGFRIVEETILDDGFVLYNTFPTLIVNRLEGSGTVANRGEINITTPNLSLTNGSQIVASVASGDGDGGIINIDASESVVIDEISIDGTYPSGILSTVVNGSVGDGGEINITTPNLSLTNGGQINTSLAGGEGKGGIVNINARESVTLDGVSVDNIGSPKPSTILSIVEAAGIGDGGEINITTPNLSLTNGGQISAGTLGQGNAGNININATESVSLNGVGGDNDSSITFFNSGIFNTVGDPNLPNEFPQDVFSPVLKGNAGEINITTPNLSLTNGGLISASTFGQGNAGNIDINATESVTLDFSGILNTVENTAIGNGGEINITTPNLAIANDSGISVSSFGKGNGGSILVSVDTLTLSNNAAIESRNIPLELISDNKVSGGNITLQIANDLILSNNTAISASAGSNANGGNLNIDARFIVAFPSNGIGNDLVATADQGIGGKIDLDVQQIFGLEKGEAINDENGNFINNNDNDIDASSNVDGLDGTVNITTTSINPLQGTVQLPTNVVKPEQTTEQTCQANREIAAKNGLVINGKGGIPPAPDQPLTSQNLIINGEITSASAIPEPIETSQGKIQLARGIKVTNDGRVILTAYPTNNAGERIPEGRMNCGQI